MSEINHVQQINDNDFIARFKPKKNHLDDNASFDGCMYETYGTEYEYVNDVLKTAPCNVWTVIDCDGELVISNGWHFVNRMGYIITEVAFGEDELIEVIDDDVILPYSIDISTAGNGGAISSDLLDEIGGEDNYAAVAAANAIESLLLALACEGVDVHTRKFSNAITTTVEAIANNLE